MVLGAEGTSSNVKCLLFVTDSVDSVLSLSIIQRTLDNLPPHKKPRQAWLETLNTIDEQRVGLIDLHPEVFGTQPRIDILHQNIEWQRKYRKVVRKRRSK